ncbi:MAG: hypothetical protein H6636_07680 [Anaerolineales bacterium]|nr:hypothetical protein [Anaerolineales bacterium]
MTNLMPIWGFVSIGLAVLYFFVWPKPKPDNPVPRPARQQFILRWFHSLVWVCLAVAFFMWAGWLPGSGIAGGVALVALGLYLTFMVTFLRDRKR